MKSVHRALGMMWMMRCESALRHGGSTTSGMAASLRSRVVAYYLELVGLLLRPLLGRIPVHLKPENRIVASTELFTSWLLSYRPTSAVWSAVRWDRGRSSIVAGKRTVQCTARVLSV